MWQFKSIKLKYKLRLLSQFVLRIRKIVHVAQIILVDDLYRVQLLVKVCELLVHDLWS